MIHLKLVQGTTTKYFSFDGYDDSSRYWDQELVSVSPLEYIADGPFIRLRGGRVEITRTAMSDFDLSDRLMDSCIVYLDAAGSTLFDGLAVVVDATQSTVVLQLRTEQPAADVLADAPDLNTTTPVPGTQNRVYPRAFGSIIHERPLCLNDSTYQYHDAYLSTIAGVYDDGVSVSYSRSGNTITLGSAPTGTVTISGTASQTSFVAVISYLCGLLGLTLDSTDADATVKINDFASRQEDALGLIRRYCEFHDHIFLIDGSTLYLIDKTAYSSSVSRDGFTILDQGRDIKEAAIIKSFVARWTLKSAKSNPNEVMKTPQVITVSTGLGTGKEEAVRVYDNDNTRITTALTKKKTLYNDYQWLSLALADIDPDITPGMRVQFDAEWLAGDLHVQVVKWNFKYAKTLLQGLATNLVYS